MHPLVEQILALQSAAGVQDEDLAHKIGIDRSTLRGWRTRDYHPRLSALEAAANALGYELVLQRKEE